MNAVVYYCGELYEVAEGGSTILGREGEVIIDDNPFLHRQFLRVASRDGLWWLDNVGGQLSATVADGARRFQAWLAPGASIPLIFDVTTVWFTAGPTTYEFDVRLGQPVFSVVDPPTVDPDSGSTTVGQVSLTPDQLLLIVSLSEPVLRRGDRGAASVPASNVAAQRLGWNLTKFNRKLDYVCEKLSAVGIRGLHGGPDRLASSRKARLVEYAVASRLVTSEHLSLLEPLQ